MRGGRALPKFLLHLRDAFLVNKGVYFFQTANNLNLKLFLGCICIVYHIVFLVLNRLSNLEFRRRKKVLQVFQIRGGNLDNIQKKAFFLRRTSFILIHVSILIPMYEIKQDSFPVICPYKTILNK